MSSNKTYLGDGLYADFDSWQIVLTAEDGDRVTNKVFMEPEVATSFLRFIEKVWKKKITIVETEETS